jgi:hypothetical protein
MVNIQGQPGLHSKTMSPKPKPNQPNQTKTKPWKQGIQNCCPTRNYFLPTFLSSSNLSTAKEEKEEVVVVVVVIVWGYERR